MPIKEGWRVSAGIMGVIGVCHVVTMSYLSYSSTRHNATGKSYGDFNSAPEYLGA